MTKKEPKIPNLDLMERRLVQYESEFMQIIGKWNLKYAASKREKKEADSYIYNHIIELLSIPDLKVVGKKLNSHIMRTKVPLLRSYYKEAREDLHRLKKIRGDHKKFEKAKELRDKRDRERAERAALRAGEKATGVLPAQRSDEKRTERTLETFS